MDWNRLKQGENPRIIRIASWIASPLVGLWVGGSLYALAVNAPDLFQRLGAWGVGALLVHYVFIRFTWRRRGESISSMEGSAFCGLLIAKSGAADLKVAEQRMYEVNNAKTEFVAEEAKSVVVEAALLVAATVQWGFGDLLSKMFFEWIA
mgnify:CR=1 FL=1